MKRHDGTSFRCEKGRTRKLGGEGFGLLLYTPLANETLLGPDSSFIQGNPLNSVKHVPKSLGVIEQAANNRLVVVRPLLGEKNLQIAE